MFCKGSSHFENRVEGGDESKRGQWVGVTGSTIMTFKCCAHKNPRIREVSPFV